jgi:hypothetical protein
MDSAVMGTAERDSELVACPSAERARLHMPKMMWVRGLAAAEKTWLLGDVSQIQLKRPAS